LLQPLSLVLALPPLHRLSLLSRLLPLLLLLLLLLLLSLLSLSWLLTSAHLIFKELLRERT
jgi:hypothetical protein